MKITNFKLLQSEQMDYFDIKINIKISSQINQWTEEDFETVLGFIAKQKYNKIWVIIETIDTNHWEYFIYELIKIFYNKELLVEFPKLDIDDNRLELFVTQINEIKSYQQEFVFCEDNRVSDKYIDDEGIYYRENDSKKHHRNFKIITKNKEKIITEKEALKLPFKDMKCQSGVKSLFIDEMLNAYHCIQDCQSDTNIINLKTNKSDNFFKPTICEHKQCKSGLDFEKFI